MVHVKKSNKNISKRNFLIFLFVISFLLVIIFHKKLTPMSESLNEKKLTSSSEIPLNWKRYTNNHYNFSFAYPSISKVEDSDDLGLGKASEERKSGYHVLITDTKTTIPAGDGKQMGMPYISIDIFNKSNYAFFKDNINDYYTNSHIKNLDVNGLKVYEIHHEACPGNKDCISVGFRKDKNVFMFDTWVWDDRYGDKEIILNIIKSMRFDM